MKDVSKLTEAEILSFTVAEQLFSGNVDDAKQEYRKLTMAWHPDRHPDNKNADSILAKISTLYTEAESKFAAGTWEIPGLFTFTDINGKKFQVKYKRKHTFELGDMYIGSTIVTFVVDKSSSDLVNSAKSVIKGLSYSSPRMETEVKRYMPEIQAVHETETHNVILVKKHPDMILLKDVLDHFGGKLDPKHVAWVLSGLYNISCYFKFSKIVHNAIALDTYFVNPIDHSGSLLGGWWYTKPMGTKMVALPGRTASVISTAGGSPDKIARPKTDSELIKMVGRELLGDGEGTKLLMDTNIPNTLLSWLRTPGNDDHYAEYELWAKDVLIASFGERKFHKMDVAFKDVYK